MTRISISGFFLALVSLLAAQGCSDCRADVAERRSPDGAFVVGTYSSACGPVAPFDFRVALRRSEDSAFHDVVTIMDAPFEASAQWQGPRSVLVTFDCPFEALAGCAPPTQRHWSVQGRGQWSGISLTYAVGARLRSTLTPDQLAQLPK